MRPAFAVTLTCLVTLWAGCIESQPAPATEAAPSVAPTAPEPFTVTLLNDTNGSAPSVRYDLDVRNLTFQDTLRRFVLVAEGDVRVNASLTMRVGSFDLRDGCTAGMVSVDGTDGRTAAVGGVTWYSEAGYRTRIQAGPVDVEEHPFAERAFALLVATEGWLEMTLSAGERILVEVGGRDDSFVREGRYYVQGEEPNRFDVALEVQGAARLETLPDRVVRCGMGSAQAEAATVQVKPTFLAALTVDGTVALTPGNASTLLYGPARGSGPSEVALTFGDERQVDPYTWNRAEAEPLPMAIHFGHDLEPLSPTPWFMADVHWPVLVDPAAP